MANSGICWNLQDPVASIIINIISHKEESDWLFFSFLDLNIFEDEVGISKNESCSLENITFNPVFKDGASFKRSSSLVFSDSRKSTCLNVEGNVTNAC